MGCAECPQDGCHCLCESVISDESLLGFYNPDYMGRPDAASFDPDYDAVSTASTACPTPVDSETEDSQDCFATELPFFTPMESNGIFLTGNEHFAELHPGPSSPIISAPTSLSILDPETTEVEFTKQRVDDFFGGCVKREKFEKMHALNKKFLKMRDAKIAHFDVHGELNVFGFNSVHVLDRANFDLCMDMLADDLIRNFLNGRQIKERKSCIYEIFQQCGMAVVRSRGAPRVQPGQKKSLKQDAYVFKRAAFENNKKRAIQGW
jgi:hypothetical protein